MSVNVTKSGNNNPGCLVQVIWFVFIGSWASQIWLWVAWILMLLIVTMPIGIAMINMLPKVVSLREPRQAISVQNGVITVGDLPQRNFFLRAIYFVLVGWWLSIAWMEFAWFACASVIGLPIGFWMFDKTPAVLTLRRQ